MSICDVILVDIADTPYQIPHDMNACVYLVKWPITFLLWITLPDCRKHPALKMITFFICIIWIGVASYAVAMIITIIGECVIHLFGRHDGPLLVYIDIV